MPSRGWQVLGVDLNRSESAGTPLAYGPLGLSGSAGKATCRCTSSPRKRVSAIKVRFRRAADINVVEKEKLRLDVSVGDRTSGKVQLFSRINPAPIKAWRLRLGHLLPRRRGRCDGLGSSWRVSRRSNFRRFEYLRPV